jgi:hypothetical protein
MKKSALFLILTLFAAMPAFAVKYVAVVETEVDARSGASAEITPAEVTLITAELRREAVNNLPPGQYSVMTSETVIAQGSAFAVDCNEENCVIALGSKIGADYIVRGTISKFRARFALTVEIYETADGNLVASSDPVRSENVDELIEKAAEACGNMYRKFVAAQSITAAVAAPAPQPNLEPIAPPVSEPAPKPAIAAPGDKPKKKNSFWAGLAIDFASAGMLAYGAYQDDNLKSYVGDGRYESNEEYGNAKKAARNRNIGYAVAGALLLTGISVHIFF